MNDDLSQEPQRPGDEAPADENSAGENICPVCGGSGEKDGAQCEHCEGTGRVIEPIALGLQPPLMSFRPSSSGS